MQRVRWAGLPGIGVYAVVACAVIAFGAVEIGWIGKAAELEGERVRENLRLQVSAAIQEARGEVWYLYDLLREGLSEHVDDPLAWVVVEYAERHGTLHERPADWSMMRWVAYRMAAHFHRDPAG